MKKGCMIVCPTACRNCDITPCTDRMADEETEEKQVKEAMKALVVDKYHADLKENYGIEFILKDNLGAMINVLFGGL